MICVEHHTQALAVAYSCLLVPTVVLVSTQLPVSSMPAATGMYPGAQFEGLKPVLGASTCYERQLSGVSEEPILGLSPSFESPELLEFLDCPWQECHRKGRYGFTGRAHLSGHLRESYEEGQLLYPHEDCRDSIGRANRLFRRKADVTRHLKSTHNKTYLNCPKCKCHRKDFNGFTRQDHLVEHLRQYHQENIPKRHRYLREPGTH
jgi:hypothetical protein